MNRKTSEVKVLRDPVHGYIHISDQVIWDLINTPEMQRLRRIKQLGGTSQVYHAAEHSRFAHSLGVYEICRRMLEEVESIKESCSEKERITLLCAALLHDLGHGPMSHFFESVTDENHERRTMDLILDPEGNIAPVLAAEYSDLAQRVADLLMHRSRKCLQDMISSQLDCDRMDYLLRDAYETGTSYGSFDLERVLRTIRIYNDAFCIKKSGMHSVEDYIMARYQMYWQVYLHPDSYGYEILLKQFFDRYKEIRNLYPLPVLETVVQDHISNRDFLDLDDCWLLQSLSLAVHHPDAILSDFASRAKNRNLFAWIDDPDQKTLESLQKALARKGFDEKYYLHLYSGRYEDLLPYQEGKKGAIQVLDGGKLAALSEVSAIADALLKVKAQPKKRVYFPREILSDLHLT